jgi:O-antigen/teichoic acid export membrane protein
MSGSGGKLIRGSAIRLASNFVTMAVGLFLMPIVVSQLGDRDYGIWVLAGSFLGFYGLLDLGISNAVSRFVSRALGAGDLKEVLRIVATSVYMLSGLGAVVFASACVLAWQRSAVVASPADAGLLARLALILGASLAVQFPARTFDGVLKSHLRYDMLGVLEIAGALVRVPAILGVLHLGWGLVGMALATASVEMMIQTGKMVLAFSVQPGLTLRPSWCSAATARKLFAYGAAVIVATVSDILRFRTSPLVITIFRGVSLVTPFALATQLTRIVTQLTTSMVGVLTPVFSRLEGGGEWRRLQGGYLLACRLSTYTAVLFGGLLVVMGRAFVLRWLGPERADVVPLLYVLVAGTVFTCAQMPGMSLLYGISRQKFYAVSNVVHGVLTLACTAALAGPYGVTGVAVGVIVPEFLVKFILQPLYACHALGVGPARWYLRYVLPDVLVPAVFVAGVQGAAWLWLTPTYTRVFAMAAASCVAFVPYALLVGLDVEQRAVILRSLWAGRAAPTRT